MGLMFAAVLNLRVWTLFGRSTHLDYLQSPSMFKDNETWASVRDTFSVYGLGTVFPAVRFLEQLQLAMAYIVSRNRSRLVQAG
jgi:hypothetical protein